MEQTHTGTPEGTGDQAQGFSSGAAADPSTVVVGVLSDPDYPSVLAQRLARELPQRLAKQIDDTVGWEVRLAEDALAASTRDTSEILRLCGDNAERGEWDLVVYLTDLPLRDQWHPIVAEVSMRHRAALVSLPALGGGFARKRTRDVVERLVGELADRLTDADLERAAARARFLPGVGRFSPPLWRATPPHSDVDHYYLGSTVRGRLRLLAGMVHSNRPWRLIFGLASALAAGVAMSIFILQSEAIWEASTVLGPVRLILGSILSVTAMVVWTIAAHHLWESGKTGADREQAVLYNTATVATIGVGVLIMHLGVFAFAGLASQYMIPPEVFEATLARPVEVGDYLRIAWMTAAAATVAGALGSGLENDESIRQAAYGYRERQRQRHRTQHSDAE